MKSALLLTLIGLSGCSWFGHRAAPPPRSTELIVSGAPADAVLSIDGTDPGQAAVGGRPLVIRVAPGDHLVEVRVGERVVYREDTYVAAGEHQRITVLSGAR